MEPSKCISGLINLGNTCYLNSILQCLNATELFVKILKSSDVQIKNNDEGRLIYEYNELQKLMSNKHCIISPKRFYKFFTECATSKDRGLFLDYQQNDAGECLQFLLETFHNSLSRKVNIDIKGKIQGSVDKIAKECYSAHKRFYEKDYSELLNIFSAIQVTTISDINDKKEPSIVCEPYMTLMLPIPDKNKQEIVSLYDCFDLYTNEETFDTNKRCIKFWSLPNTLILILNRFYNDNLKKNQRCIEFEANKILDLSRYVIGYNKDSYKYKLYSVCNHMGSLEGGHYTAYIKSNKAWYHINDNIVEELGKHKIVSQKAYMLFFEKVT